MADAGLWGEAARWYPDVVALGAAHDAWQAEFDRQGSLFRACPQESTNPRTATVENHERNAYLILGARERRFVLGLRAERTVMLSGYAPDLRIAADATQAWLTGKRPPAIAAEWPFLGSVALAIARERGDYREASWLHLYENHRADPIAARLQHFVAVAFREPRLRQLRPYTSHWTLHFSATSAWPYTGAYPAVAPTKTPGRYIVVTSGGRAYDETDAAGALQLVLNEVSD
ncbi:DUF6193 family natural product biosynthesis protein [Actinoplanes solisilvae]|uniref:DUF6193 family natural product biosynthesis protein n=1 Tax=Actinoplanes solisilvae TaxID=2486853 RepID=UPI000FD9744E|nr:DUF6193 family natural product biosynthesis protein [Actinoplanes solisilvae]